MDPYLHAAAGRGESFRIDDIDDPDSFSARREQIEEAGRSRGIRQRVKSLLTRVRWLFRSSYSKSQSNYLRQKGEE